MPRVSLWTTCASSSCQSPLMCSILNSITIVSTTPAIYNFLPWCSPSVHVFLSFFLPFLGTCRPHLYQVCVCKSLTLSTNSDYKLSPSYLRYRIRLFNNVRLKHSFELQSILKYKCGVCSQIKRRLEVFDKLSSVVEMLLRMSVPLFIILNVLIHVANNAAVIQKKIPTHNKVLSYHIVLYNLAPLRSRNKYIFTAQILPLLLDKVHHTFK